MRMVDLFYIVAPAFHPGHISIHWMDLLAPIGIGGIWLWMFLHQLQGKSLLPLNDPRFVGASGHAHGTVS